ncbi:MAG TPA: tetratricopeptide repeat protein, partial [Tepidisphaeraceae bacterium]|nr:tetratricopeptide repeat protein [Tepidisphaeraceae bacterium]
CRRALQHDPRNAECVYLLAVLAHDAGRMEEALKYHDDAVNLSPQNAVFINARGEALLALRRIDEAMEDFRKAATLRPSYERVHNNLGRILHLKGDFEGARKSLEEALRLNPRYTTAMNNLGAALQAAGDFAQAAEYFRKALQLRPDYPEALYNLGISLNRLGQPMAALESLRQAIRLRPNYAMAHYMIGQTLLDMAQVAASVEYFKNAVRLQPDSPEQYLSLGNVLLLLTNMDEAAAAYDRALQLRPDFPECLAQRFLLRQQVCDWSTWDQDVAKLTSDAEAMLNRGQESPVHPLYASSLPWSGQQILAASRGRARYFQRFVQRALPLRPPAKNGRLKIAYLSGDFYDHPVGHLVYGLFGLHDRAEFEIHAYSFGPNDLSQFRARIQNECEFFEDIRLLSIPDLAKKIRDDGIEILVDMMGYTGIARTGCVAMRPAPIQAQWLGFPCTMGADFIDYMIGDPLVTPPRFDANYHEKIVRLPHSFITGEADQETADRPPSRKEQNLPEDAVVFCCFNNTHKIDPAIFDVWMNILRQVPGSVAWMSIRQPTAQANLRREAQRRGISPDRLIFSAHVASKAEHLARHGLADLFLDTRYYNAHATACDALWSGVPVLTCPGETFASRVGASLVTSVGLPELVMPTLEEYQRRAVELATDRPSLLALRDKLQAKRPTAPLFDAQRFVANLERGYRAMWQIYLSGGPPQPIDVLEN